jgi:hypothetical protein
MAGSEMFPLAARLQKVTEGPQLIRCIARELCRRSSELTRISVNVRRSRPLQDIVSDRAALFRKVGATCLPSDKVWIETDDQSRRMGVLICRAAEGLRLRVVGQSASGSLVAMLSISITLPYACSGLAWEIISEDLLRTDSIGDAGWFNWAANFVRPIFPDDQTPSLTEFRQAHEEVVIPTLELVVVALSIRRDLHRDSWV